jgi:hypothetical protein
MKIKIVDFYELHSEAIKRSSTDAGSASNFTRENIIHAEWSWELRNPQEVVKWH